MMHIPPERFYRWLVEITRQTNSYTYASTEDGDVMHISEANLHKQIKKLTQIQLQEVNS